jgi:type II secretory pathway component GspD/PulD (secretin)
VPDVLDRILADLKLIDRPTRHVMLNAKIVVLDRGDLENIGLEWDWPTVTAGIFTNSDYHGGGLQSPEWPWGVQIGYTPGKEFTNSLMLTLNLLGQNDDATVVASPQLMAQDGKLSEINVATEEYFQIESEGVYARSQLEKIDTGTILKITPRIGEKGSITLDIETEVSGVIARGADGLPVVTRRTAKSTVRVENGGTAAIAGLLDSRTQSNHRTVPGISQLPLLGWLFQNDSNSQVSRQVAIFVTARLMPSEQDAPRGKPARQKRFKPVGKEFKEALRESLRLLRQKSETQ